MSQKVNYQQLAETIIKNVGGGENVDKVIHCITRLRFYLKDPNKADPESFSNLSGVAGAVYNKTLNQFQVIIGPAVEDVYDAVVAQLGDKVVDESATRDAVAATQAQGAKEAVPQTFWQKTVHGFQTLIGTITGSMIPVVGLLAASGILKGILTLITELKWVQASSPTYVIINAMGDAVFYFLPILVGFTAAKQLGSDPITVAAIGGLLVHPTITAIYDGTDRKSVV